MEFIETVNALASSSCLQRILREEGDGRPSSSKSFLNQPSAIPKPSMDSQSKAQESAKKYLTAAASVVASAMLARTVINEFLPGELRGQFSSSIHKLFSRLSTEQTIIIRRNNVLLPNDLYNAASAYLRTKISPTTKRLTVSKRKEENNFVFSLSHGDELADVFEDVQYRWKFISQKEIVDWYDDSISRWRKDLDEVGWFEVSFPSRRMEITLNSYFPSILKGWKEVKGTDRKLKLYMNRGEYWYPIDMCHHIYLGLPKTENTHGITSNMIMFTADLDGAGAACGRE